MAGWQTEDRRWGRRRWAKGTGRTEEQLAAMRQAADRKGLEVVVHGSGPVPLVQLRQRGACVLDWYPTSGRWWSPPKALGGRDGVTGGAGRGNVISEPSAVGRRAHGGTERQT